MSASLSSASSSPSSFWPKTGMEFIPNTDIHRLCFVDGAASLLIRNIHCAAISYRMLMVLIGGGGGGGGGSCALAMHS